MTDKEGYQLVEKEFDFKGHNYLFLEELGDNWRIYRQLKGKMVISFELVHLERQEQYEIAGNIIPKKWTYPSAAHWGDRGFTYKTLQECYLKFNKFSKKEAKKTSIFNIPVNTKFTVKELAESLGVSRASLLLHIQGLGNKIKVVGEKKNIKGKDSKVLVYNP